MPGAPRAAASAEPSSPSLQGTANLARANAEPELASPAPIGVAKAQRRPVLEAFASDEASGDGGGGSYRPVLSLAQALAESEALDEGLYAAVAGALSRRGARLDKAAGLGAARPQDADEALVDGEPGEEPGVLRRLRDVCVLWKPASWTVTVNADDDGVPSMEGVEGEDDTDGGAGPETGGRRLQDWVASNLGASSTVAADAAAQHGIVHRLDAYTSGLVICATSYRGYYLAQLQFTARRVRKEYLLLCHGHVPAGRRSLEGPLRSERQPEGYSLTRIDPEGKRARTEILEVVHLVSPEGLAVSLVQVRIYTGRQHQIRVHLAGEGHPLVGDATYGGQAMAWCERSFLHARRLSLDIGDGPIDVRCPLPGLLLQPTERE